MTALKWITTEAKRLKKAYPNRFAKWTEYVAQASAIYAKKHGGKSPIGKKKKSVGDYKINKGEFVESKKPTSPRKKKLAKKKVWSVTRTSAGRFKKKGIKRVAGTGSHKDTKSHNVNIRVVSGTPSIYSVRDRLEKMVQNDINLLAQYQQKLKDTGGKGVAATTCRKSIANIKKMLAHDKKQLREQNKLITQLLK